MFTFGSLLGSFFELLFFGIFLALVYYGVRYVSELIPLTDLKNRAVFVTGCDSGFGRGIAIKLAQNGIPCFAGCFTEEGRKGLEKDTSALPGKLYAIHLDVSKDDSVLQAYEYVKSHLEPGQKLWAVLNNAGTAQGYGPDEWNDIDIFRKIAEVNTYGITFLPLLKESKGRILTTTSVQSRLALVYYAPYVASKYAAEGYMDVIRRELKPWGISCHIFNPGAFYTPMASTMAELINKSWKATPENIKQEYGEKYKTDLYNDFKNGIATISSPHFEHVYDNYYHAITAMFPRARYACGWDALLFYVPMSFLPTWLQDWIGSKYRNSLCATLPAAVEKKKNQ